MYAEFMVSSSWGARANGTRSLKDSVYGRSMFPCLGGVDGIQEAHMEDQVGDRVETSGTGIAAG